MAKVCDVEITVISRKGACSAGHKVGDKWVMGLYVPQGLCSTAFAALYPFAKALRFGAEFPFAKPDGSVEVICPDAGNPLVFALKRIEK